MNDPPHAVSRALERYGLKLTHGDMYDLCLECQKGYGRLSFLPDGKERHLLMAHNKAIVVVYAPFDGQRVHQKEGRIITILPKEAASPGAKSSVATKPNKFRMRPNSKPPKKSRKKGYYQ